MANQDWKNETVVTEFILLDFGNSPELNSLLFLMFLSIYFVTITGNTFIVVLVVAHWRLHTPMYFFLGNLACLEICYSSNILPRMLLSYVCGDRHISARGCFTQYYFFGCLAATECYLLAVMSYDRYLAVCKPLHYPSHMDTKLSLQLGAASWVSGFLSNSILTFLISNLDFCGPNEIDHFFCDSFAVMKLSCSDTQVVAFVTSVTAGQARWAFEQSGLVEGVPVYSRVWNEMSFKVPSNPNQSVILWFYENKWQNPGSSA
ncbi:Olfactory receptor 11A1 [Willisornis vidua]|uniref:Olfactory receptor n=1 Tax=Willisornis vidua TaxID=1566151 RepID=A0ABQ9D1V7_9PASS|nr:Olfactory receptor 11A1 [Willisornis vidua]